MSKTKFRDLFPIHILLMILCVIFFSVIMRSESILLSAREQGLIKVLIYVLGAFISIHFILKSLRHIYLSGKVSFFNPLRDKVKNEASFKDFAEEAAPSGYKLEVSQSLGFSFCYPEGWITGKPRDPLLYKEVREPFVLSGFAAARNFNISCQDISRAPDIEMLFKAIIDGVIFGLKGSGLEFRQNFKTQETFGMRYKVVYKNPQQTEVCCYQVAVTNSEKKSLIILTFTADARDFPKTQKLFDDIANLVNISRISRDGRISRNK